jgi:hypothetical protein
MKWLYIGGNDLISENSKTLILVIMFKIDLIMYY